MNRDESLRMVPLAANPAAIPLLVEWFHAAWHEFDQRTKAEIAAQLGENLQIDAVPVTFLALRGDEIVGTISLDRSDLESYDHLSPWLASLYVVPSARSQGIGEALIHHVIQFAERRKFEAIFLWTPGPTILYQRMGWREIDRASCAGKPVRVMKRTTEVPERAD